VVQVIPLILKEPEIIERARQLAAVPSSDPDAALFAALEAVGAGDTVSNAVDHLEETIGLTRSSNSVRTSA
jgi:hypothetical protein